MKPVLNYLKNESLNSIEINNNNALFRFLNHKKKAVISLLGAINR